MLHFPICKSESFIFKICRKIKLLVSFSEENGNYLKAQHLYPLKLLKCTLKGSPCFLLQFLLWSYVLRKEVSKRRSTYVLFKMQKMGKIRMAFEKLQSPNTKEKLESN